MRATPYPTEDVGWIIQQAGDEVCMFSSDFPHVEGLADPLSYLDELRGLDDDDIRKIMGGNMMQLLGLAA